MTGLQAPLLPAAPEHIPPAATGGPGAFPLAHLSASSIAMFLRCPDQFRRGYLLGEWGPPSAAMLNGRAVHRAHEVNFLQKIATGVDLPVDEVTGIYEATMGSELDAAGGESEVEWRGQAYRGGLAGTLDRWATVVSDYHRRISPHIAPLAVEERIVLDVDLPVPIIGYIDLLCFDVDAARGEPVGADLLVIDHKVTGGRADRGITGDRRLQGSVYAMAKAADVVFHTHTTQGFTAPLPGEPSDSRLPHHGTAVTARYVATRAYHGILDCHTRYGPDEPWPGALTHSWACDYCQAKPDCVYWTGQ